jgi:hypothetical protein
MTSYDPITAALQELAEHHEQLTQLDERETAHFTTLSSRLTELTDLITGLGHTLENDGTVLARFEALDRQVLAAIQGDRHWAGGVVAGERCFYGGSGCGWGACDDTVSVSDTGRPSPVTFG